MNTYCTKKYGEVLQIDPQATASILLPSLSSKHQLIDKIKNKKRLVGYSLKGCLRRGY